MLQKTSKKEQNNFRCEKCDYTTSRFANWQRHLKTKKHNAAKCCKKRAETSTLEDHSEGYSCHCGKHYKHRQSFERHSKRCQKSENVVDDTHMSTLIKHNSELIKLLMDSSGAALAGTTNNTINNHTYQDKVFNINLFLSDNCASALSIQDFANDLKMALTDIDDSKPGAIANVVIKNLQPMPITERPFHCTDPSSNEWYVKDKDNGWEQDTGERVIESAEHGIRKKWPTEFVKAHPDWTSKETLQNKYVSMASKASDNLTRKQKDKVLRDLSSVATLNWDNAEKALL